jgi:DNA-binding IclR family transcriptional regulator
MLRERRLQTIKTTETAFELLQIVSCGEKSLNINRLSRKLMISREEVLILLVAMENRGLVSWDSGKKIYNPGRAVLEMASTLVQQFGQSPHHTSANLRPAISDTVVNGIVCLQPGLRAAAGN